MIKEIFVSFTNGEDLKLGNVISYKENGRFLSFCLESGKEVAIRTDSINYMMFNPNGSEVNNDN